jgi:hypothetical protein
MIVRGAILVCLVLTLAVDPAHAGIFLRGHYGLMDQSVYRTETAGSPFLAGSGGSLELGLDLSRRLSFSAEIAPSYSQPVRNISEAEAFEDGRYRLTMANFSIRMEPIDSLQPYLVFGGGQGIFTFDYGDTGQIVVIGGNNRRIVEEDLTAWIGCIGFGFETPLASWLGWGVRARFLYHRWRADTSVGRFLRFDSGHGYAVEANLTIHL